MLALCQTGFRTGGCHGSIDDFGVTLGGDYCLGNQHFVADRAVLALRQASFRTGGCHGGIDDLGMALSGDYCLGNQDFVADRALLAPGEAVFGAGGSVTGDGFFGVTGGGDFRIGCVVAAGAGIVFCPSAFRTGCSLPFVILDVVAESIYLIGFALAANRASMCSLALRGAGCSRYNLPFAPIMAKGWISAAIGGRITANGAGNCLATGHGAGRIYIGVALHGAVVFIRPFHVFRPGGPARSARGIVMLDHTGITDCVRISAGRSVAAEIEIAGIISRTTLLHRLDGIREIEIGDVSNAAKYILTGKANAESILANGSNAYRNLVLNDAGFSSRIVDELGASLVEENPVFRLEIVIGVVHSQFLQFFCIFEGGAGEIYKAIRQGQGRDSRVDKTVFTQCCQCGGQGQTGQGRAVCKSIVTDSGNLGAAPVHSGQSSTA